jgi:hypothetical protein
MIRLLSAALFGLMLPAAGAASAQTPAKLDPAVEAAMKTAMPGDPHKDLAKRAGTYSTVTKSWTQPGAAPIESKGTARISVILGGRFIQEENDGESMGFPYEGVRVTGYNNAAQKYEATWYYTGSTATMNLTGTSKDNGKTIAWIATFEDQKGLRISLQVTTTLVNANTFVVDLRSRTPQGQEGPRFETTYTRQR